MFSPSVSPRTASTAVAIADCSPLWLKNLLRCPKQPSGFRIPSAAFDRGHSLRSLHPPPAALPSLPTLRSSLRRNGVLTSLPQRLRPYKLAARLPLVVKPQRHRLPSARGFILKGRKTAAFYITHNIVVLCLVAKQLYNFLFQEDTLCAQ